MIDSAGSEGELRVTYNRGFRGTGRRYAVGSSLQKGSRSMRCAGAKKNHFDIDQRNSHPTIVSSLTEVVENPTLYPSLIQYGKADRLQREDLLRVVMVEWQCDRSVAKQLYNSLINTGTVNGWEKNNNVVHIDPIL